MSVCLYYVCRIVFFPLADLPMQHWWGKNKFQFCWLGGKGEGGGKVRIWSVFVRTRESARRQEKNREEPWPAEFDLEALVVQKCRLMDSEAQKFQNVRSGYDGRMNDVQCTYFLIQTKEDDSRDGNIYIHPRNHHNSQQTPREDGGRRSGRAGEAFNPVIWLMCRRCFFLSSETSFLLFGESKKTASITLSHDRTFHNFLASNSIAHDVS